MSIIDIFKRTIGAGKSAAGAIDGWRWTARSTVFGAFFSITGFVLAFEGKLTTDYIKLVGAVQTLLTARAALEDFHERVMKRMGGNDDDKSNAGG